MRRGSAAPSAAADANAGQISAFDLRGTALSRVATATVGRMIPPALYAAVAEILAYVYELTGKVSRRSAARVGAPA